MAFDLKYIPKWNALELSMNGRNDANTYHKFMAFLDTVPEMVKVDDYHFLVPKRYLDRYLTDFEWCTCMTQTIGSIRGTEEVILPDIHYKPKHLGDLKLKPYPFQELGIAFLLSVENGIVADEMGLGKTIQAIGAVYELLQEGAIRKALVICPASLKYQWANELEKFIGQEAVVIDGTAKKRQKQYAAFQESDIAFCLVGYETVRGDIDQILTLDIDCVVADEAHRIKNRNTQTYKAMIQLQPKYRFALTGTPMQNKPDEIFALMSWIDPEVLGKVTAFRKEHVLIGEKFGRRYTELGYKNLDAIRERISPKMLRRMKKDVAPDLPDILYTNGYCEMSKAQKVLYDAIQQDLTDLQDEIRAFYAEQSDADAKQNLKADGEEQIMGYMYMMQATSDHPLLLTQGNSKMAMKYLPLIRKCTTSPKLDEMIELIRPIVERGSKIVIFSQYATMLQLLKDRLWAEFKQDTYLISGAVPPKDRQTQLNAFEHDPVRNIMLLSDAGNYGLNLQFADTLVNYDLPWNPATVNQRNGRIHRINSTFESVNIINMVTLGTIDEQILKSLSRKIALSDGLVERNEGENEIMKELIGFL